MTVLRFDTFRRRKARCSDCGRVMIKADAGNDAAYCSYGCGVRAQPQHTQSVAWSSTARQK